MSVFNHSQLFIAFSCWSLLLCRSIFLRLFHRNGIFSPHSFHVSAKGPVHHSSSNRVDTKTHSYSVIQWHLQDSKTTIHMWGQSSLQLPVPGCVDLSLIAWKLSNSSYVNSSAELLNWTLFFLNWVTREIRKDWLFSIFFKRESEAPWMGRVT